MLKLVSNVRQLFAAYNFSRSHFSDAFFLGALRVKLPFSIQTFFMSIFMWPLKTGFTVSIYSVFQMFMNPMFQEVQNQIAQQEEILDRINE